jgi:two-component system invasion response regulator UvrY
MIRIFIADDHPVVRQGVRQIVASHDDLVVAGEATTGRETVERLPQLTCDVVLLDLSLPDIDGLDLLKELRRARPQMPVLVLTMHSEAQFAVRALKAGAAGYVTKESAPSELVTAIRKVVVGGHYVTAGLAERLAANISGGGAMPHESLTDREYQVFRLMAAGKSSRQIASALSLSIKTVSTHRARIFEKMQMTSAAQLAAYAVRNRLTD